MEKSIVIDATGHVMGMLASKVAKLLLEGWHVTILCTENIIMRGKIQDCEKTYKEYKNKRCLVNPIKGAFHYKEPSKYFKIKVIRGMIPRKTTKGSRALERCVTYEGIPKEFENVERSVVPYALAKVAFNPRVPRCTLGELLSRFGWSHASLAQSLTQSLKEREAVYSKSKSEEQKQIASVIADNGFQSELKRRLEQLA